MSRNHDGNDGPIDGEMPFASGAVYYPIVRVRPGAPIRGLSINPMLYGVPCHYCDGRTVPCVKRWGPCGPCVDGLRQRWYGYLASLEGRVGRIVIVEVTKEAAAECALLHQAGAELRGRFFTLERIGESKRGRCKLTFSERDVDKRLPDPVDVRAALARVWGFIPSGIADDLPST